MITISEWIYLTACAAFPILVLVHVVPVMVERERERQRQKDIEKWKRERL
jgi:hypothetical protein